VLEPLPLPRAREDFGVGLEEIVLGGFSTNVVSVVLQINAASGAGDINFTWVTYMNVISASLGFVKSSSASVLLLANPRLQYAADSTFLSFSLFRPSEGLGNWCLKLVSQSEHPIKRLSSSKQYLWKVDTKCVHVQAIEETGEALAKARQAFMHEL
jgi:hypothetical protein